MQISRLGIQVQNTPSSSLVQQVADRDDAAEPVVGLPQRSSRPQQLNPLQAPSAPGVQVGAAEVSLPRRPASYAQQIIAHLETPGAIDQLASAIRKGEDLPAGGSAFGNMLEAIGAAQDVATAAPRFVAASGGNKALEQLADMDQNPQMQQLRQLYRALVENKDDPRSQAMLSQLDTATAPLFAQQLRPMLQAALRAAASNAEHQDFVASAKALSEDIGVGGRMSQSQIGELAAFLRTQANQNVENYRTLLESGTLDASQYLKAVVDETKLQATLFRSLRKRFNE